MDRSARHYDADGRLHVAASNISKAAVNPYYGREIPGAEGLGLNLDRVYHLLRDPDELEKAAPTFNNLPILSRHVPVSATGSDTHQPDLVVGSTGTDAAFDGQYLRNSLVIWAGAAIAGIEQEVQRELSSAYRYVADMTPGTYKGLHYDGVMRSIVGNHVALVQQGRAGRDVVVGDQDTMAKTSRTALMLTGALHALIAPRLAADKALDVGPLVRDVNRASYRRTTADLPARIVRAATPLLAADEGIDVDDVVKVIHAIEGTAPDADADVIPESAPAVDGDGDLVSRICAMLEGKVDADVLAQIAAMGDAPAAEDEDAPTLQPPGAEPVAEQDKPAMDAATIRRNLTADFHAIRQAERDVAPFVGEITVAMDSAAAIYRMALDHAGVDHAAVRETAALRAMVALLPKPGEKSDTRRPIAMDAKAGDGLSKRFGDNVNRLRLAI